MDLMYNCVQYYDESTIGETDGSNKIEIEYDIDRDKCLVISIFLRQRNYHDFELIAIYRTKYAH